MGTSQNCTFNANTLKSRKWENQSCQSTSKKTQSPRIKKSCLPTKKKTTFAWRTQGRSVQFSGAGGIWRLCLSALYCGGKLRGKVTVIQNGHHGPPPRSFLRCKHDSRALAALLSCCTSQPGLANSSVTSGGGGGDPRTFGHHATRPRLSCPSFRDRSMFSIHAQLLVSSCAYSPVPLKKLEK